MFKTVLAISAGASVGAVLRWFLGTKLNHILPAIPLGTLAANLIGGYLIGFFIAFLRKTHHYLLSGDSLLLLDFWADLRLFQHFQPR